MEVMIGLVLFLFFAASGMVQPAIDLVQSMPRCTAGVVEPLAIRLEIGMARLAPRLQYYVKAGGTFPPK